LDKLEDEALWRIARAHQSSSDMVRYQELLDLKAETGLSQDEDVELDQLRLAADRFMLRKAHAVALLRWRGHTIPPAHKLQ
jgi:hypothetical protein